MMRNKPVRKAGLLAALNHVCGSNEHEDVENG
jgi:hypothetical protein